MDWVLDLLTQLRTVSNYSAVADPHTLETIKKGKAIPVTGRGGP
jgi:hypothetical protein